jgi:hypothetical protein
VAVLATARQTGQSEHDTGNPCSIDRPHPVTRTAPGRPKPPATQTPASPGRGSLSS